MYIICKLLLYTSFVMDMTGRPIPENLSGHRQLLTAAMDASISGIIITDFGQPDYPIIYCNKAFEKLTGYQQEEILGKNCRFLQGKDRTQSGRYKLRKAIEDFKECHVEMINYRKDGTVFWNELYIAPIISEGRVTHYIGIQNDISDRKRNAIALKSELTELLNLNQFKYDFISTASHELKTPLTSLKASMQLLSRMLDKDHADDKQLQLLSKANVSLNRLTSLVDDLLNVAKLDTGYSIHEYTDFKLSKLIDEVVSGFGFEARHQITITGEKERHVIANKGQIEQVIVNLLNNAVKYTADDKHIAIAIQKQDHQLKVSIKDFGTGIPADELPHVFDQYYRGNSTASQISGLGLGLYVSSEIIKSHQGEIGVHSIVGQGSTFWFTIPAK